MKSILVGLAALTFAVAASATYCGSNTLHPGAGAPVWPDHCNDGPTQPPSTPTPPTNTNTLTGDQRQQQGQAQGQLQGQQQAANARSRSAAQSTSDAAGAGANAGYGAGAGAGSNNATSQTTNVSTGAAPGSGSSYTSLAVSLPDAPPAIAPTMVAGNITATHLGCGALVREVATNIYGYDKGMFGSVDKRVISQRVNFMPYLDENGQPKPYLIIDGAYWGHEVVRESAVLSISSGASLSIAGFGDKGGASGGGGTSSGMTAMAGDYSLRLCFIGKVKPAVIVPPTPPIVRAPVRRPASRRKPIAVAATPDPTCMASAAQSCKAKAFSPVALTK